MTDAPIGTSDGVPKARPSKEHKSTARLQALNFDPMGSLVDQYRKLEGECAWWEGIRDGTIVAYLGTFDAKGEPRQRQYSFDAHMRIFEQLVNIGDKLMRYAYGRVPETQITENRGRTPFVINLANGSKKNVGGEK
jgi:hypothetical protein